MMFSVDVKDEEQLLRASNSFEANATAGCAYCNGQLTSAKLLSRNLKHEEPLGFGDATVQLFGHPFVVASLSSKIKDLFLLLNQHLHQLEDSPNTGMEKRVFQEGTRFLHCLECYFHRCLVSCQVPAQSVAIEIANELQWVYNTMSLNWDQSMFQLYLHVMWTSLAVTYHLIPVIGVAEFVSQVFCVANKLLSLARAQFNQQNMEATFNDTWTNKLWLTLYHMLSSLSTTHLDTFWFHISNLLTQQVGDCGRSNSWNCFSWWFLAQLSTVCGGHYWQVVHDHLLPLSFSLSADDESEMRCVLQCACTLTHQWTPSLQVITKAWELFYRNMNATKTVWISPTVTLSASQWAHCTAEWQCSYCSQSNRVDQNVPSCFELFLRMVSCTITCNDQSVWPQVRGRILSKVHSSWISKLEPCGIERVVSLLLVLSTSAPDQQVIGNRAIGNLTPCLGRPMNTDSKNIVWRGIFAHLIVLHKHGLDLSSLIAHFIPQLNHLVGHLSGDRCYETLWVVLGCIQELLELQSACELGATDLIGPYLTELLSQHRSLEGSQLSKILLFIEGVASSFAEHATKVSSTQVVAGCSNLLHCCLPVLSSLSKCPSPPALLMQSAASLYHLASCSSSAKCLQYRLKLVEDFGLSEDCNPRIACGFLCHILSDQSHDVNSIDEWRVAHCWLRCLLSCDCQLAQFTNLLTSLPNLTPFIQTKSTEPSLVLNQLLSAINTNFSKLYVVSSDDCSVWRSRLSVFLGDLMKYCASVSSPEMHKMVLLVTSLVVSVCPRIIYSKLENKCLLPQIVDCLVLPLATGNLHQLRPTLHMFLIGLLKLEPEMDGFIKRKLKQIFGKYFQAYAHQLLHPLTAHLANPFLLLLDECKAAHPTSEVKRRLFFTIEMIVSEYLVLAQSLANLLPVLHFLVCVTQTVNLTLMKTCNKSLLSPLLSCLLKCTEMSSHPSVQVKEKVLYLLRELLKEHFPSDCLLDAVRNYLTQNLLRVSAVNSDMENVFEPLLLLADCIPSWKGHVANVCMRTMQELIHSEESRRRIKQYLAKFTLTE